MRFASRLTTILLSGVLFVYLFSGQFDITSMDIGRHITNGKLLFSETSILFKNVYSYTEPNETFANHHWLAGWLFFKMHSMLGINGLHISLVLLALLLFIMLSWQGQRFLSITPQWTLMLITIPLICEREEIRPELISNVFLFLEFWLIYEIQKRPFSIMLLLVTTVLFALWANIHSYFVIGLFILEVSMAFKCFHSIKKNEAYKNLILYAILPAMATLINPNHINLWIFFFSKMTKLGYPVLESAPPFDNINTSLAVAYALSILAFSGVLLLHLKRKSLQFLSFEFTMLAIGVSLSLFQLRFMALWGTFFLFFMPKCLAPLLEGRNWKNPVFGTSTIIVFSLLFLQTDLSRNLQWPKFGVFPPCKNGIEFIKQYSLKGPIFNSFGTGSFLINELYPNEKVFIDARPEAYSNAFIRGGYIRMQQDDEYWRATNNFFAFQLIYFGAAERSQWGQRFLKHRLADANWKLVFRDRFSLIMVPNTSKFAKLKDVRI